MKVLNTIFPKKSFETLLVFVFLTVQSNVFSQNWNFFFTASDMSTLANTLASGNVSINTGSSSSSGGINPCFGRGDILFAGDLVYSNSNSRTLALTSSEDIWINGNITSTVGALHIEFNIPSGKKVLINGDISTNGGNITVNNGGTIHFQKTSGVQTIQTGGGAINFNNSSVRVLRHNGSLVLNTGVGALSVGGSGTIEYENTFYQMSATRLLNWGGPHSSASGVTEKSYGITVQTGRTYSARIYYWDSWDGEIATLRLQNSSNVVVCNIFRARRWSDHTFSDINPAAAPLQTLTAYQTSIASHFGNVSINFGSTTSWLDQYVDVSFVASFTGDLRTWNELNQPVSDESQELHNVWEIIFTNTSSYTSGNRSLEFTTTSGLLTCGTKNIVGMGSLTLNTNNTSGLIGGVISGATSVVKLGTGTVKLTNKNTYTGGTTVNAGVLQLDDINTTGDGTIIGTLTVNAEGTVSLTGFPSALGWKPNRVTTLNINGGLLEATGGQQHIWNMTGGVNFSGGGTIRSNNGSSSATATSYIEWGGSNVTVSSASASSPAVIAGRVNLRNDLGAITFNVNNSSQENDLIISAAVTQASATNLIKSGTGKMAMTGANTYTGTTTISAGTMVAGSASAMGSGNVILAAGATLLTGRAVATLANNIVLNGNATIGLDRSVEVLLVGGGGGGSSGGGGAGGVVSQTMALNSGAYTVAVGAGGSGGLANVASGTNGGSTVFNSVTAFGGGGGGKTQVGGLSGASGGGTGSDATTAGGAAIQGNPGGTGISTAPATGACGGGGAGTAGSSGWTSAAYNSFYGLTGQNTMGGNAGIGVINSITGTATYYGGGGGGGCNNNATTAQPVERAGQGGAGGGGRGANANNGNGIAGTANTGGGGGGGDWEGSGAAGGSGVVIIRYAGAANGTGGTIANGTGSATGYSIHTFTAVGNSTLTLNASNLNLTGVISGTGGLTYEANDGSITLSAANTYSGNTVISTGSVILNTNNTFGSTSFNSTFTNNGTFTLKDGASFIPSPVANSITGSGTFTVEKALAGNSAWSPTTGRFWYMGVPMISVLRNSFGSYDANANRLWSYSETMKTYTNITDNNATLSAGTGYVHRRSTDGTLTFSATGANGLFREDHSLTGLTRTSGASVGFHLISNPYMAYLDWHAVTKTNVESTYYIRSNNAGNNISALITYNGSNQQLTNNSSLTLTAAQMQYIAPLQSIWVRVGPNSGTGSLSMTRSMLSHQPTNVGLKTSTIFPTLARVNLVDGGRFDQMLVFMNQDMSNSVDEYDSEKMFVSGNPQLYTMAAGKKLVMNGLNSNKKKISVPIYLELPESKVYNLQLADYNLEDGLILLEDKQEGTIQDFTIHDTYAFYANSGVLQNRFVLHFYMPDATITAQGPSNSWVEGEAPSYTEGGNIVISSDSKGKVQISLDQPDTDKVEGTVQVTDANGKVVYNGQLEGLTTEFELNVPSGIYYLTVQSGNILENKKVFVQD